MGFHFAFCSLFQFLNQSGEMCQNVAKTVELIGDIRHFFNVGLSFSVMIGQSVSDFYFIFVIVFARFRNFIKVDFTFYEKSIGT